MSEVWRQDELQSHVSRNMKLWRENAQLSQAGMSKLFGIPLRTLENWDMGARSTSEWAERLIVDKLIQITEETIVRKTEKEANKLKSDENGLRPVGAWVTVSTNGYDEFVHVWSSMIEALNSADKGDKVAYVLCNQTEDGPRAWYEDRNGQIADVYTEIQWEK